MQGDKCPCPKMTTPGMSSLVPFSKVIILLAIVDSDLTMKVQVVISAKIQHRAVPAQIGTNITVTQLQEECCSLQ